MHGLHLTADLYDCTCATLQMTDARALESAMVRAVSATDLTVVGHLSHTFPGTPDGPGGVTCSVLLAESHVCVHTWPELRSVALDVYVCNFSADNGGPARALLAELVSLFQPQSTNLHELTRGHPNAPPGPTLANRPRHGIPAASHSPQNP